MEVTYRKNLSKSYMCIREQKPPVEQYELQMLERHIIPGLLSMQPVVSDGERRYLYNISGKQQMEDYFCGKKIGYEMLKRFLISIQQICLSLSEYLLREGGLCLEMEFIFISLDDGSLHFTYLPFYEKSLPEAFTACMEQILRKLDHQEKAAVELGYRIYQLCTTENADIEGVMAAAMAENILTVANEEKPGKCIESKREEEAQSATHINHLCESEEKHGIQSEGFERKVKACKDKWKEKSVQISERARSCFPALSSIFSQAPKYLSRRNKREIRKRRKNLQPSEELQIITFSEDMDVTSYPTEVLAVQQGGTLGKLAYRGMHQCANFQIEGDSFLLGKNSEQVDGVISADGVSRLHARISRKENKYFIEDLNSTNGTFVNDVALEYREPHELKANDKIRFAAEEYIFF